MIGLLESRPSTALDSVQLQAQSLGHVNLAPAG